MKFKVAEHIKNIKPYVAGKPLAAVAREYGITDSIKLASNENPLGPSPMAAEAIRAAIPNQHRYPDEPGYGLLQKIARYWDLPAEQIVIGNGSDEILGLLATALLQPGDEVIVPTPSFLMYTIVAQCTGAKTVRVPMASMAIDLEGVLARVTPRTRLVFLCNPNNPTGTIVTKQAFETFLAALPPGVVVVMDEAYAEFVRDARCARGMDYLNAATPVVTTRTFSKAYGLAGLRVGYGVMPAELAELLNRVRMPFNVNSLAQAAASAALEDTEFLGKTVSLVHQGLDSLYARIEELGLKYFPSQANFFLIDLARDAKQVFEQLLRQGVIVRAMTEYGFPEYIRINVGLPEENQRFIKSLRNILAQGR